MNFFKKLYRGLASFGFASILLLFLLLLTWVGTLEQVNSGLYDVQKKYFESILLVHDFGPFDLRLPSFEGGGFHWSHHPFGPIPLPLPGVYLLLALLLLNLVLGGLIRIKKSNRTWGIIVAHVGIVMMLVAGFVKFKFSVEGNLALNPVQNPVTGEVALLINKSQNDVFQSYTEWELAIHEAPTGGDLTEHVIPADEWQWDVVSAPVTFTSPQLPFDVTVTKYFRNCVVYPKGPMFSGDGPVIDGYVVVKQEPSKEAEQNLAGLYATFTDKKSGAKTEAILYGGSRRQFPYTLVADGKPWIVDLRKRIFPLPFSIRLDQFTYETHPGTMAPSVYLSDVTKIEGGREQALKITMNEPLRHEGYTLYQASYGPQNVAPGLPHYSVFAVVKNPSDQWPKWSCYVIALGLLWHFGAKLLRYVKSQRPVQPVPVTAPTGAALGEAAKPGGPDSTKGRSAKAVRTHA